jgi:ABC-type transport system involved in cytochrome c biogenesis permease subunit
MMPALPVRLLPPARRRPHVRLGLACLAAALVLLLVPAPGVEGGELSGDASTPGTAPAPWPDAVLDALATIPIQAEGRIKPLHTWARYTLLGMNHRASAVDAWGRRQEPLAWLLDALVRPEIARRATCFLVQDDEAIDAIGLPRRADKKKRDRYTYEDLLPARERLMELGSTYAHMEATDRTRVQTYVMELAHDVARFEDLLTFLDFADGRAPPLPLGDDLAAVFDGQREVGVVEFLARAPAVVMAVRARGAEAPDPEGQLGRTLEALTRALRGSRALRLFPPGDPAVETWLSPHDVASQALLGSTSAAPGHLTMLAALRDAVVHRDEPQAVQDAIQRLHDAARDLATSRGEYEKVGLEVFLARFAPFSKALWLYVLAFLLLAFSWLRRSRWLTWGALGLIGVGLLLHVTGISIRCVLRERPPVSTLYETVLFISASIVLACLVIERIDRRGVALAIAPVLGALGLFVADRYEVLKGEDTMPQLVAVLDTNFWLTVHVLCITIGYAGGLLASAIAHVHVLGRVVGLRRHDKGFDRSLARMVYGTLCFALLFSVVGTILGGIWANESWGRFWGWDPKENGALMIVLVQLAILHGRMGGLFKAFGVSMATIFSGIVVAFSWWGVNLLGIGLHSYGHTSGVARALNIFYAAELGVLLVGGLWWVRQRPRAAPVS